MTSTKTNLFHGALAGAAATTALNAATFVDMAVRKRPASTTPEQTVERGAALIGLPLPEESEKRQAWESGLGSLLGAVAGVAAGVALGALKGTTGRPSGGPESVGAAFALAMLVGNGPMTVLGITDPRTWSAADWAADVLPHVAYAVVAAAALEALDPDRPGPPATRARAVRGRRRR